MQKHRVLGGVKLDAEIRCEGNVEGQISLLSCCALFGARVSWPSWPLMEHAWNPNDLCFGWKRPCFGGFNPQNRGQTGSRWVIESSLLRLTGCLSHTHMGCPFNLSCDIWGSEEWWSWFRDFPKNFLPKWGGAFPRTPEIHKITWWNPVGSMYGIFTYIYHKNQPNVGIYTSPMDPMGMDSCFCWGFKRWTRQVRFKEWGSTHGVPKIFARVGLGS